MSEMSANVIQQLRDDPEGKCIRIATGWGTVYIRYRPELHHWAKSVWMPLLGGGGRWYECRVYAEERAQLLAHEHDIHPMEEHPNAE